MTDEDRKKRLDALRAKMGVRKSTSYNEFEELPAPVQKLTNDYIARLKAAFPPETPLLESEEQEYRDLARFAARAAHAKNGSDRMRHFEEQTDRMKKLEEEEFATQTPEGTFTRIFNAATLSRGLYEMMTRELLPKSSYRE